MDEKELLKLLAEQGFKRVGETEAERSIFGGKTQREAIGLFATDPITQEMIRKMFALGRNMGLTKDEIKMTYGFESFKKLTVGEGIELIDKMAKDAGEEPSEDRVLRQTPPSQPKEQKPGVWTKAAGVNLIDGKMARCGQCTSHSGVCDKGILKGRVDADKIAPMSGDCFESKFGPLVDKKKEKSDEDVF